MNTRVIAGDLTADHHGRTARFMDPNPLNQDWAEGLIHDARQCAGYTRIELTDTPGGASRVYRIDPTKFVYLYATEEKESPEVITDAGAAALVTASPLAPFRNAVPAASLNGHHLHRPVRFNWAFDGTGVRALITGYLREIHHDLEGVTLWVSADDEGTAGKTEFILNGETNVDVAQ